MHPLEIEQFLKENGLRPSKTLGQNFLLSDDVLDEIIVRADIQPGDRVLEVGPGLGFLTDKLLEAGAIVDAVELSDDMYGYLKKLYKDTDNITLHHQDILQTQLEALLGDINSRVIENDTGRSLAKYKVVANIPYYLTGKIIPFFLESTLKPESLTIMIQKEVAERLIVKDGKQSKLSIATSFFAEPSLEIHAPKDFFYPVPKVDSAVVMIKTKTAVPDIDQKSFFRVMRAAFSNKRKQMHNGLAGVFQLSKEDVFAWLDRAEVARDIRPEKLSVDDYVRLTRTFPEN